MKDEVLAHVRPRSGFGRCGTTPIRARDFTLSVETSQSATRAVPAVGFTRVVNTPIVVFPAPFRPEEPEHLALMNIEIEAVQCDDVAVNLAQAADLESCAVTIAMC